MLWRQTCHFPDDYFVYSCSSSSPSLTRLPPCFDDGGSRTDPKLDKLFQPHSCPQQLTMFDDSMGILCHGDDKGGEFTVAHLTFRYFHPEVQAQLCLLHHPASNDSMEWSVDVVLPIGGRCLCWVDYYQGMLLLDVLTATKSSSPDHHHQQQLLHYVQLPSKALRSRRVHMELTEPDPLRCLSVSDAGIITLVCIITKEQPSPSYPFTIATWTLVDIQHGRWEKDPELTMEASQFFRLCAAQSCLPQVQPSFPVVSLVDPDVVCFLLRDMGRNLFWTVQSQHEGEVAAVKRHLYQ
ncbi:hypothetical protein U9M48_025952 [Paspalum notatum var. saurae]|uniref:DUF1618 domain-containing protein n=1 Tax=Paspalum notatum var. saurae TaxID=547442 RepID=A0AAQ3TR62_PASNO